MKRLLLYLLFLSPIFSEAQTSVYHPFPEDSAKWCDAWSDCSGGVLNQATYQLSGKVLINGNWYSRMLHYENHCFTHMTMCLCDSIWYTDTTTYYIRQDISQKKVWLFNQSTNSDTIFLDFDLHVGDTIDARKEYWAGGWGLWMFYTVISIDSALIDGQYRRQFKYADPAATWCLDSMIEGIGPMHGLFYLPTTCFEAGGWTNIFSENNRVVYSSFQGDTAWWEAWHCHDFTLDIPMINENSFSISPNPTHSVLNVECDLSRGVGTELKIYDVTGREVYSTTLNSKHETLNLSLSPALYLSSTVGSEAWNSRDLKSRPH